MLSIKKLNKKYGDKNILNNINLDIPNNKFVSVIGPNGAGKSTLLSAITQLTEYDGTVIIDGSNIRSYTRKDIAKKISYLKQSNEINIKITVRDLIGFGRYPYSNGNLTEEDNRVIDKVIKYMELEDIQDKYINQISGGEKQRSLIAVSLAQDSKYILLDEPLNNLDIKHSVQIMQILNSIINTTDKTVIAIIHDLNFVSKYSDFIIGIKKGNILFARNKEYVMNTNLLNTLYDYNINIEKIGNQYLCNYF